MSTIGRRGQRGRNDLAHEGRTPNHSFEELVAIVEVTTAVVILNVLQELGLSAERQREIVLTHPKLRHTVGLSREWLVPSKSD
ncbi:HEPN domain-containing protein [Corynebacterium diphtheriae]